MINLFKFNKGKYMLDAHGEKRNIDCKYVQLKNSPIWIKLE